MDKPQLRINLNRKLSYELNYGIQNNILSLSVPIKNSDKKENIHGHTRAVFTTIGNCPPVTGHKLLKTKSCQNHNPAKYRFQESVWDPSAPKMSSKGCLWAALGRSEDVRGAPKCSKNGLQGSPLGCLGGVGWGP